MFRANALLATAFALMLTACATPQTDGLRGEPRDVPLRADISKAPFYAQRTNECGPAALAMVLAASGLQVNPDDLVREVYTPGREGSLTTGLITATRRHGRLAYLVPDMHALFREVAAGRPVVILENLALPWVPQWHYAVVVGYDLDRGTVTLHSGTIPRLQMTMETLERTWARGNYWALLALTPGDLPVVPDRGRYVNAAVGFEQTGQTDAARNAYTAGLRLWPDDLKLRMGLGNTLYAAGRLADAADAFARAVRDHPLAGDAFNNLAQVRLELGQIGAAETAARQAIGLGGSNIETYRRTLAAIMAAK
jgi:tetratricopeptide (TPR) repeat protein